MNISEIPAYMLNIIAAHMSKLIEGGMEASDALPYAVSMANEDIQSIGRQMLAGNYKHNADEIQEAIAASVYHSLRAA